MEKIEELMEIVVILPNESFGVVGVESSKVLMIQNLIKESVHRFHKENIIELIEINGCYGLAAFPNRLVFGFYTRRPSDYSQKLFQEKIIELQKRQVEASEKIAGEIDNGETWKK